MRDGLLILTAMTLFGCATTQTARVAPAAPAEAAAPAKAAAPADSKPPAMTPAEEPEPHNNTIKWTTASEVDNFGFDVYRGDGPDGPFERINVETIEGAGTVDEPTNYRYVDDTIDPRRAYYYYVEAISMDGVRERFTPVGKAVPKIKPEVEAEPEGEEASKGAGSV